MKWQEREKGWRSVNIKKINFKNNYRKTGKKKDNDMGADMAQLKCSNNKCYTSTFRYI